MTDTADIVICGAGIAGVSAAYHLAVVNGIQNIILVDERPPLTLTSDKSTECYRNWWPEPGNAMVALMNRSIDLMEEMATESGNVFRLNRRGYLYLSADPTKIPGIIKQANQISALGGGTLRIHRGLPDDPAYIPHLPEGYLNQPTGADLFLDPELIRKNFPYLAQDVVSALHVRRAGWFSAQQLGMYLLEKARSCGVRFIQARLTGIKCRDNHVEQVSFENGDVVRTSKLVLAVGPMLKKTGEMLGLDLPVFCELHQKITFNDHQRIFDRHSPLLIWNDSQRLNWLEEEKEILAEVQELNWLLEEMPAGVHTRPEGGPGSQAVMMLWEYHTQKSEPIWPPVFDPQFPEIVLRGLMRMLPGLSCYFGKAPRPIIDGGYYVKTPENRPLIGRMPVDGVFVIGALSGFGLMAACAAGELVAACVLDLPLPEYARAFSLERYSDPQYIQILEAGMASGQL